jgi:molybdate transport system substrate-binding protein
MNLVLHLIALGILFSSAAFAQKTVHVAVASNFLITLDKLSAAFSEESGCRLIVSSGSTGSLYAQIVQGAPYDIYLAADTLRPARVESSDFGIIGSRFTYAIGQLVLWGPAKPPTADVNDLLDIRHLAIANPETAPYGKAAKEWLTNRHLWTRIQENLVYGSNIGQVFQYTSSGATDAGIVARSLLDSYTDADKGAQYLIPVDEYSCIEQQAVLLSSAVDSDCALDFLVFLQSDMAITIIRDSGYQCNKDMDGDVIEH